MHRKHLLFAGKIKKMLLTLRKWKLLISALILLPFIVGNSPLVPFHEYKVTGHIQRTGGGLKQNFILTLIAKYSSTLDEKVIELKSSNGPSPSNYIQCITDSSGLFYLDVTTKEKADSLAIIVSTVDKESYESKFISLNEFKKTESYIDITNDTKYGCMGLSSEPVFEKQLERYIYTYEDQKITIPY